MGNNLVGRPMIPDTNEIKIKWLQHQIAERKSIIARFKLDIQDLTTVRLPQLEELILKKENELKMFTQQIDETKIVDV